MEAVIKDFEQRVKDMRSYLRMLVRMSIPGTVVRRPGPGRAHSVPVDDNWCLIGKATAYLLLYNLVESAVRAGLQELYGAVRSDRCTCELLSDSLRAVFVDQRHRTVARDNASPMRYREASTKIVDDIIHKRVVELSAGELPGAGSLDARRIRDVCEKHGLELRVHRNARGGVSLQNIKAQRNALAHGERSFAECGREVTLNDLEGVARETELFVRGFLRSLQRFIAGKKYMGFVVGA